MHSSEINKQPSFVLPLILTIALVLFSAAALLFGRSSDSQIPFDTEVWNRNTGNERLRVVSDLKPKLSGLSKAKVEQLLGEPVANVGLYPGDYYYYVLGTQRRFMDTDGIWLCLKFKNGRVDAVQIAHD